MLFLNRTEELERLMSLSLRRDGGLAVIYGRRRIGKTRLLREWVERTNGSYSVADESSAPIQRRYFAESLTSHFTGFADVEYPDWRSLLVRMAKEAKAARFRGPIVLDEFPYLIATSPELASTFQAFVDHDAKDAKLVLAIAGSSQRMMQGLVLDASAPLFGRASVILEIRPLDPTLLRSVFVRASATDLVEIHSVLGGVPRYWELAEAEIDRQRGTRDRVDLPALLDRLVLDPLSTLHREPDRLLAEETPSVAELRPVLDAIGSGAHRVSEIGGRLNRDATALSRPLARLVEMGIVVREVPFGEVDRNAKRSLYRIADPLFRLWFRVVAPHRSQLAVASSSERLRLLDKHLPGLVQIGWEDLVRSCLLRSNVIPRAASFQTPRRWWYRSDPEWDAVSRAEDGRGLLVEAKWRRQPFGSSELSALARELVARGRPELVPKIPAENVVSVLCVPSVAGKRPIAAAARLGVLVVTADDLLRQQ